MVEPDLLAAGGRGLGAVADREACEIVVIRRRRGPHEDERAVRVIDDGREAEHVFVELLVAPCVSHVQHGVIHSGDHRFLRGVGASIGRSV
ncbi:MAG: hypothetical protein R2697_08315 [Ilumatobacteraceae bacterium]